MIRTVRQTPQKRPPNPSEEEKLGGWVPRPAFPTLLPRKVFRENSLSGRSPGFRLRTYSPRLPGESPPVALVRISSPVTVAGQRWNCTIFPIPTIGRPTGTFYSLSAYIPFLFAACQPSAATRFPHRPRISVRLSASGKRYSPTGMPGRRGRGKTAGRRGVSSPGPRRTSPCASCTRDHHSLRPFSQGRRSP